MMSLSHAVRVFLNTLFPYRKDAETVASLDPTTIENIHHVHMVDDVVALLPYNDERVRACVHELKYHDNERAAHLLGTVVNTYVRTLPGSQIVLIPIPLSHERHQSRGYNQCTRIAQRGARGVSVTVAENVLTRTRDTVPQTTLSKSARRKNVAHAFALKDETRAQRQLAGTHVVLLDDVTTTGATLHAARAKLAPLPLASLTCLAVAH